MLPSLENAKLVLSKVWIVVAGFNAMAVAIFVLPLFTNIPTEHFLLLIATVMGIGFGTGLYLTFRSKCGTTEALFRLVYALLLIEFLFVGGSCALATSIAGRPDLCWLAFWTNCSVMVLSLTAGICREGRILGLWGEIKSDSWKEKLEKYVDYAKDQVSPQLTASALSQSKSSSIKSPFWIIAIGSTNIPLLFEMYGGGRNNVIYFAAPLLTCTLAYINLKHAGPAAIRLFLLRKLEKSFGRRFINADYEQIQELRRTFFLARWLMKDYRPPQPAEKPEACLTKKK